MEDPNVYPSVKLGPQTYEVRYRQGDIVRLFKLHKIDVTEAVTVKGAEAMERLGIVLFHGIAHCNPTFKLEEIYDLMDYADTGLFAATVNEALSKVSPQSKEAMARLVQRVNQAVEEAKLMSLPATAQ